MTFVHLPQPHTLAERLLERAWDLADDAERDDDCKLLEQAAQMILSLNLRLAHSREQQEARS
jgi:hypothetical protein